MRVLIVDDSADLRDLLRALIVRRAPEWEIVGEAGNGRVAVELARGARPDVILLDVAMPVMDGLEALPLLQEAAPDAGIIILSAFSSENVGPIAMDRGALGFVEKTRVTQTLVPEMRRLVAGSRGPGVPVQVGGSGFPRPRLQGQADPPRPVRLEQEPITREH